MKPRHLIEKPVIDCIASGRDPTVHELFHVAERIWTDVGSASIPTWSELPVNGLERLAALRAAKAALGGSDDHPAELTACAASALRRGHRGRGLTI
jgi:hypothetical protein